VPVERVEDEEEGFAGDFGGGLDDAVGGEGAEGVGFVVVEVFGGRESWFAVGADEVGYVCCEGEVVALGEADGLDGALCS
jgi:hypothetical protein